MLDSLPAKIKRAFLLPQLEGMRYQDIAIKLNVNERTVKRYMAEAFTQCLMLIE
jgi:DNA-directed RNA polymerase specialized sigma24 family protein